MANMVLLQASAGVSSRISSSRLSVHQRVHDCSSAQILALRKEPGSTKAEYRENNVSTGIQFRRSAAHTPLQVVKAAGSFSDSVEDWSSASSGTERTNEDGSVIGAPMVWKSLPVSQQEGIVLSSSTGTSLQALTKDAAMGLVLREAAGTSWTTGSGLEGPTDEVESDGKEEQLKFPDLSKSPRRKMRVAFTCNVCGERTIRAINPLAYTDGTVFVQCKGCDVFHKLVDNLNLFHEMRGKIYRGYDIPWYANDQPYNFLDGQYPLL